MKDRRNELSEWFVHVKNLLDAGGIVEFAPQGHSMWPTLRPGRDVVRLVKSDCSKRGDIVLAVSDNPRGVYLHRLVDKRDGLCILMGDSNLFQQEVCTESQIIGKVVAISRNGRDVTSSVFDKAFRSLLRIPMPARRFIIRIINLFNH